MVRSSCSVKCRCRSVRYRNPRLSRVELPLQQLEAQADLPRCPFADDGVDCGPVRLLIVGDKAFYRSAHTIRFQSVYHSNAIYCSAPGLRRITRNSGFQWLVMTMPAVAPAGCLRRIFTLPHGRANSSTSVCPRKKPASRVAIGKAVQQ